MLKWVSDKTAADIRFYWSRVKNGEFDQETLGSLLVAAREYAPKGSPSREIGDFIAHPKRDRGIFLERFEMARFLINGKESNVLTLGSNPQISISIPTPLAGSTFAKDLGQMLSTLDADDESSIAQTINDFGPELTLCYLGLLHHSILRVNGKSDVVLKVSCLPGLDGVPEDNLSLRGHRVETMLLVIMTELKVVDWCDFHPLLLSDAPHIRAIRGSDGLKLRMC
jgi:hypothetical protein